MTTIQITLPDQLELVARSAGLLTPENITALLQQRLQAGAPRSTELGDSASDNVPADVMALERLIGIAKGDTGQSRRVADFLLAWWNSGACGAFDLTNLWAVDAAIADDMVAVVRLIASVSKYPDTLGYKDDFVAIVHVAAGTEVAAVSVQAGVTHADLELGVRQAARLPLATQRAAQKLRMLQSSTEADALVRAALRAPTVVQRIVWLHKAATAWGRPVQAVAACKKGCSHCCQIPLTISGKEAQLISRATGLVAVKSPRNAVPVQDLVDEDSVTSASSRLHHRETETACPFLADDACSIYEVRPLACRVLFNLDDDDLLCRHGAAQPADVPYADSRMLRALALSAQPAETLADIRDFFPVTPLA